MTFWQVAKCNDVFKIKRLLAERLTIKRKGKRPLKLNTFKRQIYIHGKKAEFSSGPGFKFLPYQSFSEMWKKCFLIIERQESLNNAKEFKKLFLVGFANRYFFFADKHPAFFKSNHFFSVN